MAGTFTATDADFADGATIAGFATVKLTDAELVNEEDGAIEIRGGSTEFIRKGTGTGDTYGEAMTAAYEDAEENEKTTYKAMGTLTIADSDLGDSNIVDFATVSITDSLVGSISVNEENSAKATVTFAGSNDAGTVAYINGVTVKNGDTAIDAYIGTAGNDTISVNAGAALTVDGTMNFGEGNDRATVNGVLRAVGWIDEVTDSLAISGSGAVAVTGELYDAAKEAWRNFSVAGSVELINAGSETALRAIRTRKEELADNTASGARKLPGDDEVEMNGWLSGVKDNGQFEDLEDWISFKYQAGCAYDITCEEVESFKVELCQGGKTIKNGIVENEGVFSVDTSKLSVGTDYQLRLTTEKGQEAFAYCVTAIA